MMICFILIHRPVQLVVHLENDVAEGHISFFKGNQRVIHFPGYGYGLLRHRTNISPPAY
jgi:hypothetical protein